MTSCLLSLTADKSNRQHQDSNIGINAGSLEPQEIVEVRRITYKLRVAVRNMA